MSQQFYKYSETDTAEVVIRAKYSPFFFSITDVHDSIIVSGKDIKAVVPTIATANATSDGHKV